MTPSAPTNPGKRASPEVMGAVLGSLRTKVTSFGGAAGLPI